jgi:hypothetical protein
MPKLDVYPNFVRSYLPNPTPRPSRVTTGTFRYRAGFHDSPWRVAHFLAISVDGVIIAFTCSDSDQ